ncbi:MAG: hypothetical protein IKD22_00010, partial [Lentisphaeria bacterium]|nr:hypothetical protein [Lentisphaeria bacterium]
GSAFVDNVIFVAAFCPVIEQLAVNVKDMPLWWALLFGACFGGNITMIGSTANIVALGMLEKKSPTRMTFFRWFKIGALCSIVSGAIVICGILMMEKMMPDREAKVTFTHLTREAGKVFNGKNVVVKGTLKELQNNSWVLCDSEDENMKPLAVKFADGVEPKTGVAVNAHGTMVTKDNVHCLTINRIEAASGKEKK